MPPRLSAFPFVGFPSSGLSRSWAHPVSVLPSCGPSRLWAIPFVGHPGFVSSVVGLPVCCSVVIFSGRLSGSPSSVDSRCVFPTARRALPAPFVGGRPVCSGRADGCCPQRRLSCQIFFGRTSVAVSRRFPLRRHFLDGRPSSWIYARLFWAGGWQLPAAPAKLAVFLLNGRPALSRGATSGRTPSCLLG